MDRLQRYELVSGGGSYSEHRQMEKVEPYCGQVPGESDEWANAEDVAKLEEENERLREALRAGVYLLDQVQNGNKYWADISDFVEKYQA